MYVCRYCGERAHSKVSYGCSTSYHSPIVPPNMTLEVVEWYQAMITRAVALGRPR